MIPSEKLAFHGILKNLGNCLTITYPVFHGISTFVVFLQIFDLVSLHGLLVRGQFTIMLNQAFLWFGHCLDGIFERVHNEAEKQDFG